MADPAPAPTSTSAFSPTAPQRPLWQRALALLAGSTLLELALIVWIACMFGKPVLNFNDMHQPSQMDDWQDITSGLELARESIIDHHELPEWNPNFGMGTPYVSEPKTFLFNPIASAPALIWGVYDGPKISVVLSLVIAGLGMHYLAGAVGVSRPWRLWAGVMMSISGALVARVFAGHFEFVVGLSLIPWIFGLSLQALRRGGIALPMLAGIANALLFLSGHVVFTVYAIPGLALTMVFVAVDEARRAPEGRREVAASSVIWRGALVSIWTFGFAAVQFIPVRADIAHFPAPKYHLEGAETIRQSFNDFYSSDQAKLGPDPAYPYWGFWEYYFYVGWVPFVGLALALLALLRRGSRFAVIWGAAMFAMYLCWAAAPFTFFKWFYQAYHPLYQFRVPSRALAYATPMLILLAASGFNAATEFARPYLAKIDVRDRIAVVRLAVAAAVVIALAVICLRGVDGVYDTNRRLMSGRDRFPDEREVAHYLRDTDSGLYYVQAPLLGQAVPPEFYRTDMLRIDAHWEYGYAPPRPQIDANITRTPKYLIGSASDPAPPGQLITTMDGLVVYRQPNYAPFASTLASDERPNGEAFVWADKTAAAQARIVSANVIDVTARPQPGQDRLLVLENFHAGWRVEVDGKGSERPVNFAGFLSVPALSGTHTYTFVFDPKSVHRGFAITLGTMLAALLLLGWQGYRTVRPAKKRLGA